MDSFDRLRALDEWLADALEDGKARDLPPGVSRAEAERLLAAAGMPLAALGRVPAGQPEFRRRLAAALAEAGEVEPGSLIGSFRIERAIGTGGMGVVYRARREQGGFAQTVALKILGGIRPDAAAMSRFERERNLLSRLEHPGIARLIDGGATERGRPWFAMEYIDGLPIDTWCSQRRVGLRGRIALVRQVCEALDYAHSQMVLHRDIKPANILVDDSGRARLVDFGLGSIEDDLASGRPEVTQTSLRWLTPEFASPEQLQGEGIDVRSEVYQVGLVLYHLLCLESPHALATKSPAEFIEAIMHSEPTIPSECWRRSDDKPGGEFGSTSQAIRRRLKGDLDRIVLMALRKEPERRYGSVRALRDDLGRYVEGRPVDARPDGAAYRLRKFISRHPWGLTAAVAGLVVAIGAVILHIDQLQFERNRAQVEATKATMISDFLVDLFEAADPEHARGTDLTVREILEQGSRQLEALEGQPATRAELADVLARIYRALGEFERSRELAEQAVALQRTAHGEDDLRVAQSLHSLGQSLGQLARNEEAERAHRRALRIVQGNKPVSRAALGTSQHLLGVARHVAESYEEALDHFDRAVAARSEVHGEDSPEIAETLNDMAMTHYQIGEYDLAEEKWQQSLRIFSTEMGPDHPKSLQLRSRLAAVKNHRGSHAEAAVELKEILEAQRGIYGNQHPVVATRLFELGYAFYLDGEYERAGEAWEECLEIRRQIFGESHPQVGNVLQGLAAVARAGGELDRAESLLQTVKSINEAHRGPRSTAVAALLYNLGALRLDRDQYESALGYFREALEIYLEAYGPEHPDVADALRRMGSINLELDRLGQAEEQLRRALVVQENLLPSDHPETAKTREALEQLAEIRMGAESP